jgi:DNA-binding transcriptional LysR family regulator
VLVVPTNLRFRGKGPNLQELADMHLIVVSFGGDEEGTVEGFVTERGLLRRSEMYDRAALEHAYQSGSAPRIAFILPHFLAVEKLLQTCFFSAIIPNPLADQFLQSGNLEIHRLPYPSQTTDVRLAWHERSDSDPAPTWLRYALRRAAAGTSQPRGRS